MMIHAIRFQDGRYVREPVASDEKQLASVEFETDSGVRFRVSFSRTSADTLSVLEVTDKCLFVSWTYANGVEISARRWDVFSTGDREATGGEE